MDCHIQWNNLELPAWEERFSRLKRSNVLQSYAYAQGASRFHRQKVRWGLITIDGAEAGLVQLFEAGFLFNLFHAVIIDRGPLWFEGYGSAAHLQAFMKKIQTEFPNRRGRKRRFLFEIEEGMAAQNLIKQAGFRYHENMEPYQTYWLDLQKTSEELRSNLNGKWRNALVNAEKSALEITWDEEGAFYSALKNAYSFDKELRHYGGISPQFLDILAPFFINNKSMMIGQARLKGKVIASILLLTHGRSATYQIGVTSKDGRALNAHHLLLWQGVNMLQQKDIKELDLGGINDQDADGIKRFKKGMGGEPYRLVGHYS